MPYFSTGEVAKKLQVSLRTLRYYDQIGLVVPERKNENGKRFYTSQNLLLLEKILLLRATSMSLEDIKKIVSHITIEKTLLVHKEQLEQDIQHLQQSLQLTHTLFNTLKLEDELRWDQLLPLFSEENQSIKERRKKELMDELFNKDEQAVLHEQLPKLESEPEQITKWINLIKRIELCIKEGKKPTSEEAQIIAQDSLLLSKETFKGNKELEAKFWEARKSEEQSAGLKLYPVDQDILQFMEKAIVSFETKS